MTHVRTTRYKDREAVEMSTPLIRAVVIPSVGANLCSLCWLPKDRELMRRRPGDVYRAVPYGSAFGQGERAGFDDMFPTIDACHFEAHPWRGVELPDHGEVWSLPWDPAVEGDTLVLGVHGVRLPYKLVKRLRFASESTLSIEYVLENLSPFDLPFLWAAHPDLAIPADAVLELPTGVKDLVVAWSPEGGAYGDLVSWPRHAGRDLSRIGASGAPRAAKYYVKGTMPEGWCRLSYPTLGVRLTMRFPVEAVPYFAFLPNEGMDGLREVFLEPCTASFDRPDVAALHHQLSVVAARSTYRWYLELELEG